MMRGGIGSTRLRTRLGVGLGVAVLMAGATISGGVAAAAAAKPGPAVTVSVPSVNPGHAVVASYTIATRSSNVSSRTCTLKNNGTNVTTTLPSCGGVTSGTTKSTSYSLQIQGLVTGSYTFTVTARVSTTTSTGSGSFSVTNATWTTVQNACSTLAGTLTGTALSASWGCNNIPIANVVFPTTSQQFFQYCFPGRLTEGYNDIGQTQYGFNCSV